MTPDPELVEAVVGRPPLSFEPLRSSGYTRSRTWRVETADGPLFVKYASDEGSLAMLRNEALVYANVAGSFLPAFVGFADEGESALLAVEFLSDALWPPPYPDDVSPLFAALDEVSATPPPADLPAERSHPSRWRRVADDPQPLLGLRICSRQWLERSLDDLIAAETRALFEGAELVHNDVYSANVCFTRRGTVLIDWGAAVRGSRWIDVAFAVLSVRVEGGGTTVLDFPGEGSFAAALAGHFAVEAPAPLPAWAEPGSTLRADMASDLGHALRWAADLLDLPPLR